MNGARNVLWLVILALVLPLFVGPISCARARPRSTRASSISGYGVRTDFVEGTTLHFRDFDLVYAGRRHVTPPQFPRGWWAYDFIVKSDGTVQRVSWSAGTGDIGPVRF